MGFLKSESGFFGYIRKNSTNILCFICFLLTQIYLLLMLFPLDHPFSGDDSLYHYLRVEALKYNIENNEVFSGVDYIYFGGGGYAGFAYPDIFLFIPALLRICGVSIGESMSVFIFLCGIVSYMVMLSFLNRISESPVCATIGAALYVLSTYRLDNIIVRFALGEILAYVFWPLILYGLYDFIFDKFKKPYLLGIGFAGMLLSHAISTALALIVAVILSLFFIKRIISDRKKIPKLLLTAGCTVLVTSFYWFPLCELLLSCDMSVKRASFNTFDCAIPFVGLFKEELTIGGIAGMGFPVFLICVPRIFITRNSPVYQQSLMDLNTKKRKNILVFADAALIMGLVLALFSTKLVPWNVLSYALNFMQFPWRFFAPASILLLTAGTIYIYYLSEYAKAPKRVMLLMTALAVFMAFIRVQVGGIEHTELPYYDDHYASVSATMDVGCGEWLPMAAQNGGKNAVVELGNRVQLDNGNYIGCERNNGTLKFTLNENADSAVLPYIWYKGYEAVDENGRQLETSMTEKGLLQVKLSGAQGKITVEHRPTFIKTISYFISLASVILIVLISIIIRRRKTLKRQKDAG